MDANRYFSAIESILFMTGEPVATRKLAELLELELLEVRKLLQEMKRNMEQTNRGIRLIEINQAWQLTTSPDNAVYIEKLCKQTRTKGLSPATLEVLAIVAYKQPITRSEIETIRGVSCEKALKTLFERELIELKERGMTGRGNYYVTGEEFLRVFGLKSLKDLPVMDSFSQMTLPGMD